MVDLRKLAWMTRLSSEAQDIVMTSWSSGTTKSYNTYLKQWKEFCSSNNIDASHATVNVGIEFLTYLFREKKLGYSAINNSARSALSNFIQNNDTIPFGKLPVVIRFMKGIFRLRPSLPKYTVIYDPQIVLDYLKTITNMTLKTLTLKVTTLLCFVTGQRNQTIHSMDIDFMHDEDEKITFLIPTLLKTTTRKQHLQPIELFEYHQDQSLCVVTHIRLYLDVTKSVRRGHTKLLLSYVEPHSPVTSATTAKWVKQTLKDAGIDTTVFTAHSTRAASTSSAKVKGLSLPDIRRAAGWRPGSTFAKFYQKPIIKNFQTWVG